MASKKGSTSPSVCKNSIDCKTEKCRSARVKDVQGHSISLYVCSTEGRSVEQIQHSPALRVGQLMAHIIKKTTCRGMEQKHPSHIAIPNGIGH